MIAVTNGIAMINVMIGVIINAIKIVVIINARKIVVIINMMINVTKIVVMINVRMIAVIVDGNADFCLLVSTLCYLLSNSQINQIFLNFFLLIIIHLYLFNTKLII